MAVNGDQPSIPARLFWALNRMKSEADRSAVLSAYQLGGTDAAFAVLEDISR